MVVRSHAADWVANKFLALVYDSLRPSTTAVFSNAIGSRKLSANEQFFLIDALTEVILLQTTQIKQGVPFTAANKVTLAHIKLQTFESRRNSLFYPGWMSLMFTCVLGR